MPGGAGALSHKMACVCFGAGGPRRGVSADARPRPPPFLLGPAFLLSDMCALFLFCACPPPLVWVGFPLCLHPGKFPAYGRVEVFGSPETPSATRALVLVRSEQPLRAFLNSDAVRGGERLNGRGVRREIPMANDDKPLFFCGELQPPLGPGETVFGLVLFSRGVRCFVAGRGR